MARRRLLPMMFHRRLALLAVLVLLAQIPLVAQMVRLTVVRGEALRAEAERRLVSERWIPTVRGRILDRRGRVLAEDVPAYEAAVDYPVLTGEWATRQAGRRARREHREEWPRLDSAQRDALIARYLPEQEARLEALWETLSRVGGVPRADLDARRREIIEQVEAMAAHVAERRREARERDLARGRQILTTLEDDEARPIREQQMPHVVLPGLDDRAAFALLAEIESGAGESLPGLKVRDARRRSYPLDEVVVEVDRSRLPGPLRRDDLLPVRVEGVGRHLVGWMRNQLYKEDIELRPRLTETGEVDRGHYRPGDSVGTSGTEAAAERQLRGLRGVEVEHLDTGEVERTPPAPGNDVVLTIDAALQARVQALFAPSVGLAVSQAWHRSASQLEEAYGSPEVGTPLTGAAVVIDVDTGDVLALATSPSFGQRSHSSLAPELASDPVYTPMLNRAVSRAYAPGSIVKPLILCAAAAEGALGPGERIACTGHFYPDKPGILRCWIFKGFSTTHSARLGHDPGSAEALMASCNIFFFELARRLGPERMGEWYRRFGVGAGARREHLGAGPQFAGQVGRREGGRLLALSADEGVLLGIGQGPVVWTPLHAADAYATIARGGVRLTPHIRMDGRREAEDLGVPAWAIAQTLEGLRLAVTDDRGTGHHLTFEGGEREEIITAPGVTVWAKSGTADAAALVADADEDGKPDVLRDGDHAWFVGLAGAEGGRPTAAIAVVVEFGGSGGRVAGPIFNQIVMALQDEGYLPKGPGGGAGQDQASNARGEPARNGALRHGAGGEG